MYRTETTSAFSRDKFWMVTFLSEDVETAFSARMLGPRECFRYYGNDVTVIAECGLFLAWLKMINLICMAEAQREWINDYRFSKALFNLNMSPLRIEDFLICIAVLKAWSEDSIRCCSLCGVDQSPNEINFDVIQAHGSCQSCMPRSSLLHNVPGEPLIQDLIPQVIKVVETIKPLRHDWSE